MVRKIDIKDRLGLGLFSYPILEFNERMETAKRTTPQMNEQERAARVYFGMLAEQPNPTRTGAGLYVEWGLVQPDKWLKYESATKYSTLDYLNKFIVKSDDAQTAYFMQLKNLQTWLAYYGLMDGIQKTLMEASRKRQKDLAALAESNAAAARALAYSQQTADMTKEARINAAENEARAKKTLEENLTKEAEIKQELENIKAGYLVEQTGGISWPWLLLGAGVFFALGKNKGKRGK